MRSVVLAGVLALVACGRSAAPEPAEDPLAVPPMPNAEPAASSATRATHASRCIKPLAATPPAIPAPATTTCPPDPAPETESLIAIPFPDASPTFTLTVELANTRPTIERGLMYRRSMSDDRGMFFDLHERRDHTFWMHNTCIPLDMLFIDTDGMIVGIVEGAAPLTDAIRNVGCASAYVLEVNGGWARKHNVTPGQRITIPI